jgi:hypothetical protein
MRILYISAIIIKDQTIAKCAVDVKTMERYTTGSYGKRMKLGYPCIVTNH